MKLIILIACVVLAVAAAAPPPVEPTKILRSYYELAPDGSYDFGYETEDGIVRSEKGTLKEILDEDKKPQTVLVVRGSYSYPKELGKIETINYEADELGYRAEGDSIPKVE